MPNSVKVLDPHVADLIAAGEVVERPASAAKELLENAIDAGATAITIESSGGGMRLLRVTDNGCGLSPDDAECAFLRHATSKIRTSEDLTSVNTLGFRGEALAALAAVSRIQLISRVHGQPLGLTLSLEAGRVTERHEAGCPEGTTIVVRDLFFNTPARQKFLKKDQTETAHIQLACQRAALSHPEISFINIRDGRQSFLTPGDGLLRSCLYSLFGQEFTAGLCEVQHRQADIRVWGFVSRPEISQGSRAAQHVLVNGRPVRSRTVTAALEEAYKNALTTGRYPACVLHIELPHVDCDVNVHPAKSEVKFARERTVYDTVYLAVKSALDTLTRPEWRGDKQQGSGVRYQVSGDEGIGTEGLRTATFPVHTEQPGTYMHPVQETVPDYNIDPTGSQLSSHSSLPTPHSSFLKYIGEALGGYLLVEIDEGLALIDKHAAHERILFDRLKAQAEKPMAQILMAPLTLSFSTVESSVLLDNKDLLTDTGFSVEEFDGCTLIVREAPADVDMGDIPALLSEMAVCLIEGRRASRPQVFDDILHLVACKAAVKLGGRTAPTEAEALAQQVLRDPNLRHCPHGRPVCVILTQGMIEKQFKR